MNNYISVILKSRKQLDEEEIFIVSQDLIRRGIVNDLYIKIEGAFIKITDKVTVLEWITQSDDKQLYIFEEGEFIKIDINDIPFDDYIKIYNQKDNKIGQFIIDKYITVDDKKCNYFLSMKTDDFGDRIFCEYYCRNSQNFVYTERILGLDRIITNEQEKETIKAYFENYKKENL